MHEPPLLEARGLTLQVGGRTLVDAIDWPVRRGQRWCVIGRNAAGKTSLLRALAGLAGGGRGSRIAAGELRWLGRPQHAWNIADAATVRAFMPQHASDRFPITVDRLLALSSSSVSRRTAADVLGALDVAELSQRSVLQLSGGERQRVALAQCAVQGAPLMLLDEPVSFQDPSHQRLVAQWLTGLGDSALVISGHDVNWMASVATHVVALTGDGGWTLGPTDDVLTRELLERTYGCRWRCVESTWIAA